MNLGFFSQNLRCCQHSRSLFGKNTISFYLCQVLLSIKPGNPSWDWSCCWAEHVQSIPEKPFVGILQENGQGESGLH